MPVVSYPSFHLSKQGFVPFACGAGLKKNGDPVPAPLFIFAALQISNRIMVLIGRLLVISACFQQIAKGRP